MAKSKLLSLLMAAVFLFTAIPSVFAAEIKSYPVCSVNFDDGSTQGLYPTGNSTYKLDKTKFHSKDYSMQILNRTETWNAAEWDLTGKMTAGNTYRFSAWIYHEGTEKKTIQLSFKINEGENYTYCRQQEIAPKTWTYVIGKYTVGKESAAGAYYGLTYVDISLYAYKMTESVECYLDGASVGEFCIGAYYSYVSGAGYTAADKLELCDLVEKFIKYSKSARAYRSTIVK